MSPSLIAVFKIFPKELFRVNNGRAVRLREWSLQRQRRFDVLTNSGMVQAKALNPDTYTRPNGASMRPNSDFQRKLIQKIKGNEVVVYSIPTDLLLVHEYGDHYSLQAAENMPLNELNNKITSFLESHGRVRSKEDWLQAYVTPSEPSSSSSAMQHASASAGSTESNPWVWDEQHRKYRRWDGRNWVWQ
ncbi:hypothetical protein BU26DRAFT_143283 [Trematosphaeria pertusa]|uniref:Tse2 ADP-ribosyltransferase toxin domain-containing protein n=1 Tax=Trematosphaeria pertusa TaxID=390896 RepID=A0A6A6IWC5_9PLEO|nr:uncharacterized protein BU26DRAFT_143283 [Trematosphaeria pertusa]KAF2254666.1 hypothetical protein BU26DRAFT_143283 [Trematosphaeria pertusa]